MTEGHSSLAVANEFIRRALIEPSKPVTQMKLRKLVYLAHGWSLATYGDGLVEDEVQAWDYGPVFPKLYAAARRFGDAPITRFFNWGDDTPFAFDDGEEAFEQMTPEQIKLIDSVWSTYGGYPAFQLSALTHEPDTPWSRRFEKGRNRPIPNNDIKTYFQSILEAA